MSVSNQSNWETLAQKAVPALASNATFLALVSPTDPQAIAQVQALTRQTNAIIRILLGMIDDLSGT